MNPVTVPLTQPIRAHGRDYDSLDIRPLTTGDLIDCGYPFIISDEGRSQRIDTQAVSALISRLASVPISSVRLIVPADFAKCLTAITGFLGSPGAEDTGG